jgi:hypothetical protein
MYIAKWSWKNEWKVFLVDKRQGWNERSLRDATAVARCHVGQAGTLTVTEIEFTTVKSGSTPGGTVPDVAPIMSSEDL